MYHKEEERVNIDVLGCGIGIAPAPPYPGGPTPPYPRLPDPPIPLGVGAPRYWGLGTIHIPDSVSVILVNSKSQIQ